MLPYACIDSLLYTFEINVYHAVLAQDSMGRITKSWKFDRVERAFLSNVNSKHLQIGTLNELFADLRGNTETDVRIDKYGNLYPLTEVLITVKSPSIYKEHAGVRKNRNTLYELRTSDPVLGPFQEVLHFNIHLVRSADQNATKSGGGIIA